MARIRATPPAQRTQADLDWAHERHRENIARDAAEIAARDAKALTERKDTDGFTDKMESVRRGQIEAVLGTTMNFNGKPMTRKEVVREHIAAGAKVGTKEGQRALINADGTYLLERQLTKTALDYAEHLIGKKPRKFVP